MGSEMCIRDRLGTKIEVVKVYFIPLHKFGNEVLLRKSPDLKCRLNFVGVHFDAKGNSITYIQNKISGLVLL